MSSPYRECSRKRSPRLPGHRVQGERRALDVRRNSAAAQIITELKSPTMEAMSVNAPTNLEDPNDFVVGKSKNVFENHGRAKVGVDPAQALEESLFHSPHFARFP